MLLMAARLAQTVFNYGNYNGLGWSRLAGNCYCCHVNTRKPVMEDSREKEGGVGWEIIMKMEPDMTKKQDGSRFIFFFFKENMYLKPT
jgi:hypothetical protein